MGTQVSSVFAGRDIIIIDLDSALLDSSIQHALAWQEALAPCGYRPSLKDILLHIARSGPDVMPPVLSRERLRTYGEAIRAMYWAIYARRYRAMVWPMPGAVELVRDLKAQGLQIAVVSTGPTALMMHFLKRLGLRELIDTCVAGEDLSRSQPDPYRVALTRLGASVDKALVIGTAPYSLRAALRLGLPFVAVGPGISPYGNWAEAGAAAAFAEFAELRASLPDLLPASVPDAWLGEHMDAVSSPPRFEEGSGDRWLVVTRDQRVVA